MIKRSETACHDLLMEEDAALRNADIAVRLGIDLFPSPLKKKKENQKMPIFETTMSNKWIGSEAKSFDEYIGLLEKHVKMLKEMRAAGVRMEPLSDDGYATFITEDPDVAGRFGILPKRNRAMKTENEEGDG
jgi:hypothetical protein